MPFRKNEKFLPHFLASTEEEADALYKQYEHTLALLASKYSTYTGLDKDDLIQEGIIGLARAKRDFEEDRSDTFNTFAIYKIKDAMREYSSKQAEDIKIPHYIREAARLITKLKKVMGSVGLIKGNDYISVWEQSATCDEESDVIKDITFIRKTIRNLADRSCTSVEQLLDRAELYPTEMSGLDCHASLSEVNTTTVASAEDLIIQRLVSENAITKLKVILSEDDYSLLYDHYVEGKTVRELAPKFGITAPSITIKIQNIVKGLQKKKEQIYMS